MGARVPQVTALMISPDRRIADEFLESLGRGRAFEIIADLRAYPTVANLDTRIRQLRPDVLLLDVATDLELAGELIRYASTQNPPVHVIGLHTQNDSNAILRSLRYGASEFLYAPFDVSIQEAAISRIQKLLQPAGGERESGKIVTFSSAKPGSGASTLAMQTAYALRRASGKRVLLADFDLTTGVLGFYLKLDHACSLVDVLQRADQIDSDLWTAVTADANGVDVLPAPEFPFTDSVEQSGLHQVLEHARNTYEWTVVDLPSIFQRLSLLTLSEADRAFIVASSELASLHLARKAVKLIKQLGLDAQKIQVLINRMDKRNTDLNISDMSKLLECAVDTSLPNDSLALQRGIILGQPLGTDSELGKAVENLAGKLLGVVPEIKRRSEGRRFAIRPLLSHN
jgi:pilus assembly protein CpaE